jgi:hypothetical protein
VGTGDVTLVPSPGDEAISITAIPARELPDITANADWRASSVTLYPARLRQLERTSRWTVSFLVASRRSIAIGALPLLRFKGESFGSTLFDPAAIAPGLFDTQDMGADRYLLIGGGFDLVAGAATVAGLTRAEAQQVTSALVDAAFATAADEALTGAALYVRESDLPEFLGVNRGRMSQVVGEFSSLHLAPSDMCGYLHSLNHGRRSTVRRDLARIADMSLTSTEVPPSEVIDEASELIAAVKKRHQVPDHPALIRLRLGHWSRSPVGTPVAFAVRDSDGRLISVSFGCHYDSVLEMHEIGLADDTAGRHLAYVEVLMYGPLRFALRNVCREMHLGLGSTTPKILRGAVASNVWAVATSTS